MKRLLMWSIVLIIIISIISIMAFVGCKTEAPPAAGDGVLRIAMVVQGLGNPFNDATGKGGQEACDEFGYEFIYVGPEQPLAEQEIEVVEGLIAQQVDAIILNSADESALVPVAKKAMENGIRVVTFDGDVLPEGREMFTNATTYESVGRIQAQIMGELIDYEGQVAILSAASTMAVQKNWNEWTRKELEEPAYAKMELVTTVYGDDLKEKSYNEALGLFKSYPDLRGIISPTTIGMTATAKALEDSDLVDVIEMTGLGLPSEMKEYVLNGTCKKFALWSPIDLGYIATYSGIMLVEGTITPAEGEKFTTGRLGEFTIVLDENGNPTVIVGDPYVWDKDNIEEWAEIF